MVIYRIDTYLADDPLEDPHGPAPLPASVYFAEQPAAIAYGEQQLALENVTAVQMYAVHHDAQWVAGLANGHKPHTLPEQPLQLLMEGPVFTVTEETEAGAPRQIAAG